MSAALRELRRSPARILTSVLALALAIGAIGVLAIPAVSSSSLRAAGERDQIPQITIDTTDTAALDVDAFAAGFEIRDDVAAIDPQVLTAAEVPGAGVVDVLGVDFGTQRVDLVRVEEGRLPSAPGEILASERLASAGDVQVGDSIPLEAVAVDAVAVDAGAVDAGAVGEGVLTVVGIGESSFWTADPIAFVDLEDAAALAGVDGVNRLVVSSPLTDETVLRELAADIRGDLAASNVQVTTLPEVIPSGTHPIEEDIAQVSTMIGLLGIVAGLVALVLLGSTTNTLITERTREAAVMGALGARPRTLRRRMRRLAMAIAVAALVVGLPLGVLVANVIARMVLQEFVGVTPDLAVSIPVLIGSAVFALLGARLVSAHAARRVTSIPLAEALRDRDGAPFGRRWSERVLAKLRLGAISERIAVRSGWHHRSRSLAIVAQVTAAIAALMIIASMATTINDFNAAEDEPWNWRSQSTIVGTGLDIERSTGDARSEVGIETVGLVDEWDVSVYGLAADTQMIDRTVDRGSWFDGGREAVVATGFAERTGIDVGDTIELELATGIVEYDVVGHHRDRGRSVFVDTSSLAGDFGSPGAGNVLYSLDDAPVAGLDGIVVTDLADDDTEDEAARSAILLIFGAIGVVVVSVAGLAVASGLAVNVFERRHEIAAMQAIGARRRDVRRVILGELLPLAITGLGLGLVAGYFGSLAIVGSFEAADAVEIGFTFATGAIPAAALVVIVGSIALAAIVVRRVGRRTLAETLRTS